MARYGKKKKPILIVILIILLVAVLAIAGYFGYVIIKQKKDNANIDCSITGVEFSPNPVEINTTTIGGELPNSTSIFRYTGTVKGTITVDYEGDWYAITEIKIDDNVVAKFQVKGNGKEAVSFSEEYAGGNSKFLDIANLVIGSTSIYKTDQILPDFFG